MSCQRTHKTLKEHEAQLSDLTDSPTNDGRVITFSVASLPGDMEAAPFYLSIPATRQSDTDRLFSYRLCPFWILADLAARSALQMRSYRRARVSNSR